MSDDKRYDGDPSTPVYDQTAEGQPLAGAASGHDHLRRDDAVTDLGDQVGAYADITDPDASASDFSATRAPVVVDTPPYGTPVGGSTTGAHVSTGSTASTDSGTGSTGSTDSGAADTAKAKAGAAKDEAADVAGDAKSAASDVAGSAKEQASKVASEATGQAKQLFGQASGELKEQAGAQQEKAAAGLRQVGDQLGSMADGADSGVAGELVRTLSGRAHGVAGWLEGRDPGSLLEDVKSYAARKPGTFIAIAAVSGLLAGRVVKSLTAEAKDEKAATDGTEGGATHHPAPPASGAEPSRLAGDVGPVAGEYDVVTEGDVPGFGAQTPDSSIPTTWPGSTGTRP
ncbi:hypothetical protein [Frigoribacterium faeni]|uniref:Uncharacterized protein YjbJ (UPF0337 family) n=1 Tax=Frigoribacterium faeni TaxID=145483 RepID=A0A7W3JK60_9MICO|nr:hypothetical protein [Frigoribacterium faeni]MBA8814357.1 uncharacterized protein YjbJ (UPF0337 family) [Frigoribacterium faeni]BFF15866.1 hypothetical protein GCM10025699_71690 [Microbacterium flavescens]GEK84813.1 hypothetical protein FFA01_31220 [Frigoribacterium faeni]